MSDTKQQTDNDSIELSTTVQLGNHSDTDKTSVVEKGKDYISLDELYLNTGQEALNTLAANCREYLASGRLHPSAFTCLQISGSETMIPMYDKMNARQGGESFLETLKKGFLAIITAAKKFLLAVIDWIITKIRVLLGFEKTEKEIAIVAENAEDVKRDVIALLASLTGAETLDLEVAELYEALPGNVTQQEAFSIIQNRNKTVIDQIETLTALQSKLKAVDETIKKSGGHARQARSRYQQAVAKLRKAWDDKETFSTADVIEFRHTLDEDIGVNINPEPIRKELADILDEAFGINLGGIGADKAFKMALNNHKETLEKSIPVRVSPEQFKRIKAASRQMGAIMMNTSQPFDAASLGALKDVIEVTDAQLIESIDASVTFDRAGVLKLSYTNYCSLVNEYTWVLNQLMNISGMVRKNIASIVSWSNKVDKLMLSYISKDLKAIMTSEQTLLNEDGKAIAIIRDSDGNPINSNMRLNYDEIYLAKHPYIGSALMTYRAKTSELRNQFKIIEKINRGLKKLGVNSRI